MDAISRSMKPDQSRKGLADSEAAVEAAGALEGAVTGASGVNPVGSCMGAQGLKPRAQVPGQGTGIGNRVGAKNSAAQI